MLGHRVQVPHVLAALGHDRPHSARGRRQFSHLTWWRWRDAAGESPYSICSNSKPALARRCLDIGGDSVQRKHAHAGSANPVRVRWGSNFEFALTTAVDERVEGFLVRHVGCVGENSCMAKKGWPRDRSTGPGGGLSTGPGGGLSTGPGGGMSTGPGGGLSTGPRGGLSSGPGGGLSSGPGGGLSTGGGTHYHSNIPPIHVFVPYLRKNGYGWAADMLATAHNLKA